MLLDDSEVHLKAGDVLVQQGTNHAWVNKSGKPCRICFVLIDLFRYVNAVWREITKLCGILDRSVVRSSVMPSAKYCWSGSSLRSANGRTTIDSRCGGADELFFGMSGSIRATSATKR